MLDLLDPTDLISDLTLDDQWPGVADGLEGPDEARDVDLAFSERDLLAPPAGMVGRLASLTWTPRMSGPRISTAWIGSPMSESWVAGSP